MNKPTENQVLRSCLDYLKHDSRVAWACRMNTGALPISTPDGKPDRYVRFGAPGMPDILGQLNDGRILMIEVKRPGGRASASQLAFLSKVNAANGLAGIAESIHDVQRLLRRPQTQRVAQ